MSGDLINLMVKEIPIYFTKLAIKNLNDYTLIDQILLIDSDVQNYEIFFDSVNSNTLPIIYSNKSDRNELISFIESNFLSLMMLTSIIKNF